MGKHLHIELTQDQRGELEQLIHAGNALAHKQTRARILLLSDRSCGQAAPTPAPPVPTATQPAPPAPTATQHPPTLAQAQPGEVPVSALGEVVGTWVAQTNEGPARVIFENDGHYRIQIGGDFFDRGSAFIVGGRFTLRTEATDSQAGGSYMVYSKKQAGQVTQLRFVLMSEENMDRGAYFDQKTYQPVK